MSKLILMRGLPGSGKSWRTISLIDSANGLGVDYCVLSTDDIWLDHNLTYYLWNPVAIGAAHKVNQAKCCEAMVRRIPLIIIDNTNITQEEMQPYIDLAAKFNYEVEQKFLSNKEFYNDSSVFIEFARGSKQDGGYKKALGLLSKELLERAAILYIDVSYEESRRRNQARYEEKLKHSILAHKVPEEDFVRFSSETDWPQLTEEKGSGYLEMNDLKVPFVTMHNEPELLPGPEIAERYKTALNKLFDL